MNYIFRGLDHRVQLKLIGPARKPAEVMWYVVYALPKKANKYASYTNGQIEYHGKSFLDAWAAVKRLCSPDIEMPPALHQYHYEPAHAARRMLERMQAEKGTGQDQPGE